MCKGIKEWFSLFQMENLDSSLTELKSNFALNSKNLEKHNNTVLKKVNQASIIVLHVLSTTCCGKASRPPVRLDV